MSDIPIGSILDQLAARMPLLEAEVLLGRGLEALGLPVRKGYTPEEVAAIGLAISRSVMANVAAMNDPLAREIGRGVGAVLDTVQEQVNATFHVVRQAITGPLDAKR